VLGPVAVADQSNAIVAIPALLRLLDLEGGVVTVDDLGGQPASAAQIVAQGGDDVLARKDHHPALHEAVRHPFGHARADDFAVSPATDHDAARTVDKDHGRAEIRRYRTLHDAGLLAHRDPDGRRATLGGLGLVGAERHVGDTVTVEQRHDLLSRPLPADEPLAFRRLHLPRLGHDVTMRAHRDRDTGVAWGLRGGSDLPPRR
jgi:predicted transposase YbfD/YdcC